jgi:hypothetical protein
VVGLYYDNVCTYPWIAEIQPVIIVIDRAVSMWFDGLNNSRPGYERARLSPAEDA